MSLKDVFDQIKRYIGLPASVNFIVKDDYGFSVNRRRKVKPFNWKKYIDSLDLTTVRVATFLREIGRRIGANVCAHIELWHAGHYVDGRRGIASLI